MEVIAAMNLASQIVLALAIGVGLTLLVLLFASLMIEAYISASERERANHPYRAGLDAAERISAMGFEVERAMYEAGQQAAREEDE